MERKGDRSQPRKPANDSLIRTFKRCHDYIYGNEGRKKDAFWELLNLIFARFMMKSGDTYVLNVMNHIIVNSGSV